MASGLYTILNGTAIHLEKDRDNGTTPAHHPPATKSRSAGKVVPKEVERPDYPAGPHRRAH